MNLERREFIQKALRAAGVVGGWAACKVLYNLGGESLVKEAQAENIFISGHGGGGFGGTSWANWDEVTESGWGDPSVFICTMTGGAASNEVGYGGGFSGANLVLTQIGDVAGASGSPPSRQIAALGGDKFAWTQAAVDALFTGGGDLTIVLKLHTQLAAPGPTYECLSFVGSTSDRIIFLMDTGKPRFIVRDEGVLVIDEVCADDISNIGDIYIIMDYDGSTFRGGFVDSGSPGGAVKPTSWTTSFNAADKVSAAAGGLSFAEFATRQIVIGQDGVGTYITYFLAANKVLLSA